MTAHIPMWIRVRTMLFAELGAEPVGRFDTSENAALAAVAPEAIRLLSEAEWVGDWGSPKFCPSCRRFSPDEQGKFFCRGEFGHSETCQLDALLRKAGVR